MQFLTNICEIEYIKNGFLALKPGQSWTALGRSAATNSIVSDLLSFLTIITQTRSHRSLLSQPHMTTIAVFWFSENFINRAYQSYTGLFSWSTHLLQYKVKRTTASSFLSELYLVCSWKSDVCSSYVPYENSWSLQNCILFAQNISSMWLHSIHKLVTGNSGGIDVVQDDPPQRECEQQNPQHRYTVWLYLWSSSIGISKFSFW